MAKVKTYRSTRHLGLQFHIRKKDGSVVPIEFSGGTRSPKVIRGSFMTKDKEVQEILENHHRYNVDFKLIKEEDEQKDEEKSKSSKSSKKEISGIKTVQDAKNYLREQYDLKTEDVNTKDKVLAKAEELKISFPDINKKNE